MYTAASVVLLFLLHFSLSANDGLKSAEKIENLQQDDSITQDEVDKVEGIIDDSARNLLTYRSIFAAKRREQIDTAYRILSMDYAKQYKMVEILIDTVFPAMNDSWIKANETDYIAGASPYPTNEQMQGVFGVVFEGIPFFGDILLRLPKITKDIYNRQRRSLEPILLWGIQFCRNTTNIFNGKHGTQLYLIEQELGLVSEDPDYVNPYREVETEQRNNKKTQKSKKKKSKKGPKLRRKVEL